MKKKKYLKCTCIKYVTLKVFNGLSTFDFFFNFYFELIHKIDLIVYSLFIYLFFWKKSLSLFMFYFVAMDWLILWCYYDLPTSIYNVFVLLA